MGVGELSKLGWFSSVCIKAIVLLSVLIRRRLYVFLNLSACGAGHLLNTFHAFEIFCMKY